MPSPELPISDRRWHCWLATKADVDDPDSASLEQQYTYHTQVWAGIEPIGASIYFDNINTNTEVTHRITIRWRPNINLFDCIIREGNDPSGINTKDVYMIRRSSDWMGRKRYQILDCKLDGHIFR